MTSILNTMRDNMPGGGDKPSAEGNSSDTPANPQPKGLDARRRAERKADEAGRKWRAAAEARGEVAKETGGPQGLEPTRYGDWERAGRCIDF
jgi:hypothetical protein